MATASAVSLRCSAASDCSGYPCAHGPMGNPDPIYDCSSRWAAGDMGFTILCRTTADCPKYEGKKLMGCSPGSDLPPWAKVCTYGL
jgi:hypothetical protein